MRCVGSFPSHRRPKKCLQFFGEGLEIGHLVWFTEVFDVKEVSEMGGFYFDLKLPDALLERILKRGRRGVQQAIKLAPQLAHGLFPGLYGGPMLLDQLLVVCNLGLIETQAFDDDGAGLFAARILALGDDELSAQLDEHQRDLERHATDQDASLER